MLLPWFGWISAGRLLVWLSLEAFWIALWVKCELHVLIRVSVVPEVASLILAACGRVWRVKSQVSETKNSLKKLFPYVDYIAGIKLVIDLLYQSLPPYSCCWVNWRKSLSDDRNTDKNQDDQPVLPVCPKTPLAMRQVQSAAVLSDVRVFSLKA